MPDFVPAPDAALTPWALHFAAAAREFLLLQTGDTTLADKLAETAGDFDLRLAAAIAARDNARAATRVKNASRAEVERAARTLAGFVQSWPGTTPGDRAAMGITVRAGGRGQGTASRQEASRHPGPSIVAEQAARFTHRLRFVREGGHGGIARPRGVVGAEVYVALTDAGAAAPAGAEDFRYLRVVTRDGVRLSFDSEHAGKTAHYKCRWLSTTGETGAWSAGTSATVAA